MGGFGHFFRRLRCREGQFSAAALLIVIVGAVARSAAPQLAADFPLLVSSLTADRADGKDVSQSVEEQALEILDAVALDRLNATAPDLDAANDRLAAFKTHQLPEGEGYRLVRLQGAAPAYALVANFGLSGPSAVRVYSGPAGHLTLTGRVDAFAEKEFFDDYLDLLPLTGPDGVFVIASGRTDDLQTGIFTAWRIDGRRLVSLWTSDILERSSYEAAGDGFRVNYCAETDDNDFRVCKRMQHDKYAWQDGSWKLVESTLESVPTPSAKP